MEVQTEAKDTKGKPLLSKKIDNKGKVEETRRPLSSTITKKEEERNGQLTDEEMAFRVMFFFIAFIVVCFCLLYVYHRM